MARPAHVHIVNALPKTRSGKLLRRGLQALAARLDRSVAPAGPGLLLWMARSLGFQDVVEGQERPQDAVYLLGDAAPGGAHLPLPPHHARLPRRPPGQPVGAPPQLLRRVFLARQRTPHPRLDLRIPLIQ